MQNNIILSYSVIIGLYIFITLSIGWFIQRKGFNSLREWSLEKNKFNWFVLSMTTFATLYSAFTFVGLPGYFYTHGIGSMLMVSLAASIPGPILFYFISKKVLTLNKEHKIITPVELLVTRIKNNSPKWFIILIVLILTVFNLPYIVTQIAGIGKVLNHLTDNQISYPLASFLMIATIFIYSSLGGMKGIIWTDVFQGIYGLILVAILAFLLIHVQFDGFFDFIAKLKATRSDLLSLPGPKGLMTPNFLIAFGVAVSFFSISFIQIFNRTLLFQNKKDIFLASCTLSFSSIIIGGLICIIGLGAAVLYPNLASGDLAMVEVIKNSPLVQWFGVSVGAFFFIAVLAGSMSTADSVLFTLGTIFTHDLVKGFSTKKISQKKERLIIKGFILFFLILSYLLALNPPTLIIDLSITSIIALSVMAPIMVTLLWKKLSQSTVLWALLVSYTIFIGMKWLNIPKPFDINAGIWGIIVCCLILFIRINILKKDD